MEHTENLSNLVNMFKIALLTSVSALPFVLLYYQRKKRDEDVHKAQQRIDDYKYEFIFVMFKNKTCAEHWNSRIPCRTNCSVNYIAKILSLIDAAQRTIDLCVYHVTLQDIQYALRRAKRRGVKIRCICDKTMMHCSGSILPNLSDDGIEVRSPKSRMCLMHHKFMLIDGAELVFGSCNFTRQAFISNWEHIIVTDNELMVRRFSEEYEELWLELSD